MSILKARQPSIDWTSIETTACGGLSIINSGKTGTGEWRVSSHSAHRNVGIYFKGHTPDRRMIFTDMMTVGSLAEGRLWAEIRNAMGAENIDVHDLLIAAGFTRSPVKENTREAWHRLIDGSRKSLAVHLHGPSFLTNPLENGKTSIFLNDDGLVPLVAPDSYAMKIGHDDEFEAMLNGGHAAGHNLFASLALVEAKLGVDGVNLARPLDDMIDMNKLFGFAASLAEKMENRHKMHREPEKVAMQQNGMTQGLD